MRFALSVASAFPLLFTPSLPAQSASHPISPEHRSFVLVNGSSMSHFGSYDDGESPLSRYAQAHPGHFLLFWQAGELFRLDSPEQIAELEHLRAPMDSLEARQRELAAEQKPFEEQQRVLEGKQHAATGNPAEQSRIGQEQGRVGQLQGEIGRKQGEIGRQQGEIGRAVYARALTLMQACIADHTCVRVGPETATR